MPFLWRESFPLRREVGEAIWSLEYEREIRPRKRRSRRVLIEYVIIYACIYSIRVKAKDNIFIFNIQLFNAIAFLC